MDVRKKLVELQGALGKSVVWGYDDVTDTDYINYEETAKNLIANGVTVQEWISVNDRLPEEDGKYLVFEQSSGRTNTSVLRFAKDARKVDRYDFKGRWKNAWYECDSEWGHYTVNSVTHWQHLPQPPKGE